MNLVKTYWYEEGGNWTSEVVKELEPDEEGEIHLVEEVRKIWENGEGKTCDWDHCVEEEGSIEIGKNGGSVFFNDADSGGRFVVWTMQCDEDGW